ncbi:hypothetical protein CSUB01_12154 [Colletotrichum sublineola]|uniref:Uncharacterized protein n=1 Tax=Colletotrichum sublineola TaxID=1173701 RepID=A0A066XGZ3_COLSU|nr:hypothetical protein CSUB01_12154 [Colletotrichum sublineola]
MAPHDPKQPPPYPGGREEGSEDYLAPSQLDDEPVHRSEESSKAGLSTSQPDEEPLQGDRCKQLVISKKTCPAARSRAGQRPAKTRPPLPRVNKAKGEVTFNNVENVTIMHGNSLFRISNAKEITFTNGRDH